MTVITIKCDGFTEIKRYQSPVSVSDGYHTFDELYEHRIELFLALCRRIENMWDSHLTMWGDQECPVWRSRVHSDGTSMEGWFIMGLYSKPGKQITYHLPDKYWDRTDFAATLDKAPEFDGHTSADVLKRLADV